MCFWVFYWGYWVVLGLFGAKGLQSLGFSFGGLSMGKCFAASGGGGGDEG